MDLVFMLVHKFCRSKLNLMRLQVAVRGVTWLLQQFPQLVRWTSYERSHRAIYSFIFSGNN
jgi:hypothetical protein